jgi:hypothetical protein
MADSDDKNKDKEDELAGTEQPFVQHLVELRDRLLYCVYGLVDRGHPAGHLARPGRADRPDRDADQARTCRRTPSSSPSACSRRSSCRSRC